MQYGMPRDLAASPHPDTAGWRPRITNDLAPLYQQIEAWVDALWTPAPDYGIEYRAPYPAESAEDGDQAPADQDPGDDPPKRHPTTRPK